MNDLGMLKAGVHVSDVARYHNCYPLTIQRLRDRYQATGTVKVRRRSSQSRMATALRAQLRQLRIDDIYIDDIRSNWALSVPDEYYGSKGMLFLIF